MPRKSPHTVTYTDLVALAAELLADKEKRYAGAQAFGATNMNTLTHQVEAAKTLLRMLKKCQPGQQANLFTLFNETQKQSAT